MAMYPALEHVLDWFLLTMRLTVLKQFDLGMIYTDSEIGTKLHQSL